MIIDLEKFLRVERPVWTALEAILDKVENDPEYKMSLSEVSQFQYLYERTAAALGKLTTFAVEPESRQYLESLVARAYGEIHSTREQRQRPSLFAWFTSAFPQIVRKHGIALKISILTTVVGCAFGALALGLQPESKETLLPFSHLLGDPAERVRREETIGGSGLEGHKTEFSAQLMTHNTRVSMTTLAFGMTYGVGTVISLFYNGIILGAVGYDYLSAGQARFLFGWLLPHGAVEIPAILLAGQAGLALASAMIGWGRKARMAQRLKMVAPDLVTMIGGIAILLIWAGLIEAFFSQYHEPILPYSFKIMFGVVELIGLAAFLSLGGREKKKR